MTTPTDPAAAEPTRVVGVDRLAGLPYEVIFRPGRRPLVPPGLQVQMPEPGTLILSGPVGVEIEFDPDDPAAVMAWLRQETTVARIDGPGVDAPMPPGDLLLEQPEQDDEPGDDEGPVTSAAVPLVIGRFVAQALVDYYKVRYVRTPAGARRYGVPIGFPIPVGRKVKPKKGRRRKRVVQAEPARTRRPSGSSKPSSGTRRVALPPAERPTARRLFWGSDSPSRGASWDDDRNELQVHDRQRAIATIDEALEDSSYDAEQRRRMRQLRDRIAADTGDDGNEPPRPPDTPDTVDGAPEPPRNPYDPVSTADWTRTGGPAGSTVRNDSGFYRDPDGGEHYVKTPSSEDAARNEVLAGQLYKLAGVDVANTRLVDHNGKLSVDSEIVPGSRPDLADRLDDPGYKRRLQEGFAVDAWLANWDVAGLGYDNVVSDRDGNPVRIDAGGALMYRAQGAPKGEAFGDSVGEWDTLRDGSNPNAAALFGDMTDEQLRASAQRVLNISPQQIDEAVDAAGFDPDTAAMLKDRLKARRLDIARRAGLTPPEQQGLPPSAPGGPDAPNAPSAPATGPQTHDLPYEERGIARRHFWSNGGVNGAEWDDDANQLRVTDPDLAASELDRVLADPTVDPDVRELTRQLRDRIAPDYESKKAGSRNLRDGDDGPGGTDSGFGEPEISGDDLTDDYRQRVGGSATTSEKQAVSWYTGTGFVQMNDFLRNPDRYPPEFHAYMNAARFGPINDLFAKYRTPAPTTVRRYVNAAGIPSGTVPGRVVTMPGLVSTTVANSAPPGWEDSDVEMIIRVPKGMPVIVPDGLGVGHGNERELILPHSSSFKVDSVQERDGRRWIELTAIPPAETP